MVVEVSPCTQAISRGLARDTAASTASAAITSPQAASTRVSSAPQRAAISLSSRPNRPAFRITTPSPGASTETSAASIAAREVPSIRKVQRFAVANTRR